MRGGWLPPYRLLTRLLPALPLALAARAHRIQRAAPGRAGERRGIAALARPEGALIWVHAASMGEVTAVAPLVRSLMAARAATALVTTTTATGAATAARLLPDALHQYLPADVPRPVARFLGHWRPSLGIVVESDLWPNLLAAAAARGVPLALVNARPSTSRRRMPATQAALLAHFGRITTQDAAVRDEILTLGLPAARVIAAGDLKAATPPPPAEPATLARLAAALGDRPRWAAVSTHAADLGPVMAAHEVARQIHPDLLLILVPRHPDRAGALPGPDAALPRWSRGAVPAATDPVWLIDTTGDTGLVFRLAPLAFIGGSFGDEGGHNPWEPAGLGAAVLSGPHVSHAAAAYARLVAAGAARITDDGAALGAAVASLIGSSELHAMQAAASGAANKAGAALALTRAAILDLWPPQGDPGA